MRAFIIMMLLWSGYASALELTEKAIDSEFDKGAPTLDRIESQFLGMKQKASTVSEKFGLNLGGSALYQKSKERSFYQQDVILSPLTSVNLGVTKQLKYGINVGVVGNVDQVSSSFFSQATSSTMALDLSIDLYKDIFGRMSRNELNGAYYGLEKAINQKEIDRAIFRQGLKKIYWTLVANNESLLVSKELLRTAKRQLADAKKRFRDSVADSGEVSRYQSQVASRNANIIALSYQRETYLQQLKELLPGFAYKEITLGNYDLEKTVTEVMGCTLVISAQKTTPLNFTLYDEILALGTKEYQSNRAVAQAYSKPDIKLNSQYLFSSKEFGYSDAFEGMINDPRGKYQIGLSINIPLGSTKKRY